jgi:Pre ATP-grasp domain
MTILQPRPPVVERFSVRLPHDERCELAKLAERVIANDPALASDAFAPQVGKGCASQGPALFLEDRSEISLVDPRDHALYDYRALLLAGEGDLVVLGGERDLEFETYCRERLGLGRVEVACVAADRDDPTCPLSDRCVRDPRVFGRIADEARRHGWLTVVPYIGTGGVWRLAGAIADRSGAEVRVAAPLPRLTERVNDKLWFAQRVAEVFGGRATPPTQAASGPESLAHRVALLARQHRHVVVKVPDSAGSAGNLVVEASDIHGLPVSAVRDRLLDALADRGWQGAYPLIVGVWEEPVVSSPSVQLWIPEPEKPPVVEAIFVQLVAAGDGKFIGAAPSELPEPWDRRLAGEAVRLACLFQELGYFGRCSFDALLIGADLSSAELHWLECNGRWGGVSVPLTLANRLAGGREDRTFAVVQRKDAPREPEAISALLARLDGSLFGGGRDHGVIVLTPTVFTAGRGMHFMVLAGSVAEARAKAAAVAAALMDGDE